MMLRIKDVPASKQLNVQCYSNAAMRPSRIKLLLHMTSARIMYVTDVVFILHTVAALIV